MAGSTFAAVFFRPVVQPRAFQKSGVAHPPCGPSAQSSFPASQLPLTLTSIELVAPFFLAAAMFLFLVAAAPDPDILILSQSASGRPHPSPSAHLGGEGGGNDGFPLGRRGLKQCEPGGRGTNPSAEQSGWTNARNGTSGNAA